jgi:hypothetical protein
MTTPVSTPSGQSAGKARAKAKSKSKSNSQTSRSSSQETPAAPPELMDLFTRQSETAQNLNLMREHEAQLQSQAALSQGRIAAIFAQLQTQLFNIWNDVWLQRQKSHNEAFKAWLKLLSA